MAVLVSQDWHPPRDLSMDAPPTNINTSVPRQRSSPANDHSATSTPIAQQPYPYPVQQQQAGWTPPHPQQPYYPSFYQGHHQQPYQIHGHPGQGQMHPQAPYYDAGNAQFAQWAYQQMMYNAHQVHQIAHVPSPQHSGQRSRAGSASTSDYFVPPQMSGYNPFPSGTPPSHPSQLPNGYTTGHSDHSGHQSQFNGYHPYRRPNRQNSQQQDTQQASPSGDWRAGSFQPPYARADAAGSSTSVNSSHSGSSRHRTNSTQGPSAPSTSAPKPSSVNGHGRGGSNTSSSSTPPASNPRPHQRTTSSSSNGSAGTSRPSIASSSAASSTTSHAASTLRKPSPLSQGTFTAAEKRMSRDDSDLTAMLEPAPGVRSGGLKGRLRRALSLNAGSTLREEDEDEIPTKSSSRRTPALTAGGSSGSATLGDDESTATVQKKKTKSLFNSRLNRSTDNISLSSTMSSASMVIRKLGNIGKLTRRNSLAGITSLFKDKKKGEEDGEDGKKGKKKKDGKASVAEPSVSMATAETDPADWTADLNGLSPAARLARQHTLKSNAEAAARAKAEQEAKAAANGSQGGTGTDVPTPWEKNTTTRQGENVPGRGLTKVDEEGMRVVVEEDSDSDEGHPSSAMYNHGMDAWEEDDDDWDEAQEEDVTIRQGLESTMLDDEEMEPWAINVRRSVERTRVPTKGILKNAAYDQDTYASRAHGSFGRNRSNSYDSTPSQGPELGPLARIPSPDPDHIDGLHKHPHNSNNTSSSFLPPLSFESKGLSVESPKDSETSTLRSPSPEKTFFSHPNSSAPALSTMITAKAPTLTHRSATTPSTKRLAFAQNLSVYDTFPATVYDRRSEPATWSRLTPALAQRIKEELNSYKMEEMEVHAASRVHTQFFV